LLCPTAWEQAVGARPALLLSRILATGQVNADDQGWMLLTPAYVESGLGFSADLQTKLLGTLEDDKLIEVQGDGRNRRVRVNVDALDEVTTGRGDNS
jgi:hypothetical protein